MNVQSEQASAGPAVSAPVGMGQSSSGAESNSHRKAVTHRPGSPLRRPGSSGQEQLGSSLSSESPCSHIRSLSSATTPRQPDLDVASELLGVCVLGEKKPGRHCIPFASLESGVTQRDSYFY